MDKNTLYETGFSYSGSSKDQYTMKDSRTTSNLDKENVVPCGAQIQSFISTLSQKKHQLKNLLVEKQKFTDITIQQGSKLDSQSIKQSFEIERQMELHDLNVRTLQEVECMKKQKLKNMQKLLGTKKSLQHRFEQMIEMKRLVSELQQQNASMQVQIQQMGRQNEAVEDQTSELDLLSQNLDNEVFHMKQTVRQSQVRLQTAQTALNMLKNRTQQTLNQIKCENKQTRRMTQIMTEVNDKVKKLREQRTEHDINSNEIMIRNHHINDTNIKLRNDLEKCKSHLHCVMKNNELLTNSIEEFTYVDEKVSKLIKKNDLKKL